MTNKLEKKEKINIDSQLEKQSSNSNHNTNAPSPSSGLSTPAFNAFVSQESREGHGSFANDAKRKIALEYFQK